MIRLVGTTLLACSLFFGGDAFARWRHDHEGPRHPCFRGLVAYTPGAYCVSRHGVVEVCMGDGSWMSLGPCLGTECRSTCEASR